MKHFIPTLTLAVVLIASSACSHHDKKTPPPAPNEGPVALEVREARELAETRGQVKYFLMNPEGKIDGFILSEGTQVNVPPHLSRDLTDIVSLRDSVSISGVRESEKVLRAEKITNTSNDKYVTVNETTPPASEPTSSMPPHKAPKHHQKDGLKQLNVSGKIQSQIYGREGEVTGVVLSDKSVVRFGHEIMKKTNNNFEVGKNLKASGYGTQNSYGKAIEATSVTIK